MTIMDAAAEADMITTYRPPKTCRAFMLSEALVKVIVGPLGSGKTTACIFEILRRAKQQQPNAAGVRQTRWAIIRNTMPQLRQTVLKDMQRYYGPLGEWKPSTSTLWLRFALADGTRVEAELLFLPLEDENDTRKLLSLQLTGAFIEELREIDSRILQPLLGRLGRFPSGGTKFTWRGVIASTNPWPDGSDWHRIFELEPADGFQCFRQPSGRSPEAENVENLPAGYYETLASGASPEFIRVAVDGRNGQDVSGSAVFRDSFNYHAHTVERTHIDAARQFLIGMDVDRNPAALIAQRNFAGQLVVHKEVFAEGMGLEAFFSMKLTPTMMAEFPGHAFVICDPAAVRRSSITEESQQQAIRRFGYDVAIAPTNKIPPRLQAVETLLMTSVQGVGSIAISREGCPTLIQALQNGYRFARSSKGELAPVPEKSHPYSDLADALGYLCLGFGSARVGRVVGGGRPPLGRVARTKPAPDRRGWT